MAINLEMDLNIRVRNLQQQLQIWYSHIFLPATTQHNADLTKKFDHKGNINLTNAIKKHDKPLDDLLNLESYHKAAVVVLTTWHRDALSYSYIQNIFGRHFKVTI